MAEGISMSPEDAAAARAAEQARLRKQRREAKIKAGGASRLDKISGLVGGLPKDVDPTDTASTTPSPPVPRPTKQQQPSAHADPEEVDISQHFYQTRATPRVPTPREPDVGNITEEDLRQMMLGFDSNGAGAGPGGPAADDPFLQMMMQGMGGAGGPGGGAFPFPFPPPGGAAGAGASNPLANMMFPGGMPGAPPTTQQAALPDRYASLWRLLHTAVALGLGLYIALWTSFSGTKLDRDLSSARESKGEAMVLEGDRVNAELARRFFWAFATAEAVLLTTRFFMDRGRVAEQGMLGMLVGFLPAGIGRYVKVGLQYGQIFSTVKADVLVCVFVLGACSWLRS